MSGDPGFAQAAEVLSRIRRTTGDLGAMLAELETAVEPEVAGWPAGARARYQEARREWATALDRMPECLDRAARAFREITVEDPKRGS
ncbi:WXG100 family type VII secretion target [Amycolatopsis orientalis]|uniref:WXG100 family type VII secretion target n=1 Tax=Amycolatopsis orientalis TaxID=31958 RepID=UPI00039A6A9F|nr:hypothetical protein [Amycolatopsis orientalis]